jgi:hypothetical protein
MGNGLFVPQQAAICQGLADEDGLRPLHAPVAIDGQVNILANGCAHGFHAGYAGAPGGFRAGANVVALAQLIEWRELDGRKALVDGLASGARKTFWAAVLDVTIDVRVQPQSIAHGAAKEAVDWDTQLLAQNVPQRLLNAAEGRMGDTSPVQARQSLPNGLDPVRRFPDQLLLKNGNGGYEEGIVPAVAGLAQACETFIRMHQEEHPVSAMVYVHDDGFNADDFHDSPLEKPWRPLMGFWELS